MKHSLEAFLDETNRTHAIKGKPRTGLEDCLQSLRKEDLSSMASMMELAGRSGMTKQELASALYGIMANPQYLQHTLLIAERKEWEFFHRLLKQPVLESNKLQPDEYLFLKSRGLVFTFLDGDKLYALVPDEIGQSFRAIDQKETRRIWERQRLAADYLNAAANLYGVCELERLVDIFNSHNDKELTLDELESVYWRQQGREQLFYKYEHYVVSNYFEGFNDELMMLLEEIRGKPCYVPEKERFLQYADSGFIENTLQLERLKTYVMKNICSDPDTVDILMENIQIACSMERPLDEMLAEFEYVKLRLSRRDIEGVMPLLVEVYNNTRMWSNRGFTPVELQLMEPSTAKLRKPGQVIAAGIPQAAGAPKTGRNDPCPCGSGKKFKKCCGAASKE